MNTQTINYCACIIYNHKLYTYFQYCKVIDTTDMSLFIKYICLSSILKLSGAMLFIEVVNTLEDLLNWPTPNWNIVYSHRSGNKPHRPFSSYIKLLRSLNVYYVQEGFLLNPYSLFWRHLYTALVFLTPQLLGCHRLMISTRYLKPT